MENKSFLSKFIFLLIIIVLSCLSIFFIINKKDVDGKMKNVEIITSMNVDTFDEDLYIYKVENNTIYTSEYFYNKYYLLNNEVEYKKYKISDKTNFYLKVLSNTEKDINNIKISYEKINDEEFNYIIENNNLLKVYIWKDNDDSCKNILLYTTNNTPIELKDINWIL